LEYLVWFLIMVDLLKQTRQEILDINIELILYKYRHFPKMIYIDFFSILKQCFFISLFYVNRYLSDGKSIPKTDGKSIPKTLMVYIKC
jgi:hypothetical protein